MPERLTVRLSLFRSTWCAGRGDDVERGRVGQLRQAHGQNAPRVSAGQEPMFQTQEAALHRHYGLREGRRS